MKESKAKAVKEPKCAYVVLKKHKLTLKPQEIVTIFMEEDKAKEYVEKMNQNAEAEGEDINYLYGERKIGVAEKGIKDLRTCIHCDVNLGEKHISGCSIERCSVCGGSRIDCKCVGHDRAFAKWTGLNPGEAEAKYLGLFLKDIEGPVFRKAFFIKPAY